MVRIICRIKPPKEDNIELISDSKIYLYKKDKNLLDKSIIKPYQYELDKFYDHDVETDVLFESEIKPKLVEDFGVFIYGHHFFKSGASNSCSYQWNLPRIAETFPKWRAVAPTREVQDAI